MTNNFCLFILTILDEAAENGESNNSDNKAINRNI